MRLPPRFKVFPCRLRLFGSGALFCSAHGFKFKLERSRISSWFTSEVDGSGHSCKTCNKWFLFCVKKSSLGFHPRHCYRVPSKHSTIINPYMWLTIRGDFTFKVLHSWSRGGGLPTCHVQIEMNGITKSRSRQRRSSILFQR